MSLQISTIEELEKLLATAGIEVNNVEELRKLLQSINHSDLPPELYREEMAAQDRRRAQDWDREEKLRQLEHVQRMRELELGYPLVDPEAALSLAQAARSVARTTGWLGSVVPLFAFAASAVTTALLMQRMDFSPLFIAALGIIWGPPAIVALVTVILSLVILRKRSFASLEALALYPKKDNKLATAIKEIPVNEETGAYSS
jgi:hypothetical protein